MLIASDAPGANLACPNAGPPRIEIRITRGPKHVDTNINLEQLADAVKGRHPSPVLGLYIGALQYGIEIDDTTRNVAPGHVCATPRYPTLTARLDRVIHIPREFSDAPCLGTIAREHEAKHAYADVVALGRFRPLLSPAIRAAVRRDMSTSSDTAEDAVATLSKGVVAAVHQLFDEMTAARVRLDAAIDSPAELNRLGTVCGRALKNGLAE